MNGKQIVTYDAKRGVSYISLVGKLLAGSVSRTVPVTPENTSILLDFDENGCLIGVELLEPALLHPNLKAIAIESWPE